MYWKCIEILGFVPMAEKDTFKFTQNSKKIHDYLLRLFQKNRTEAWI